MKNTSIRKVTMIGLMSALVFVGTHIRIKIPVGLDGTMLHLGNVFCLLSGLIFGSVSGGLGAGLGSAIFDLSSEYASDAWITFINKFAMGFVSGLLSKHLPKNLNFTLAKTISALCGSLTYIILYIGKTYIYNRYIYSLPIEGVMAVVGVKAAVTSVNGLIAVIISVLFARALKEPLAKSGIHY